MHYQIITTTNIMKTIGQKFAKAKELRGRSAQYPYKNSRHRFEKLTEIVDFFRAEFSKKCKEDLILSNLKALSEPKTESNISNAGAEHWYGIGAYNGD